jgi:hypothetical protein
MLDFPITGTVPHTELGPLVPPGMLSAEWDLYRREVGRFLAEGHEGKFVVIQGELILGFFDTEDEASEAGLERFHTGPFLLHQVRAQEPVYLMKGRWLPCPSCHSR